MISATLPSFWEKYYLLSPDVRTSAKKVFRLWVDNPFHPSLHFKCINDTENIWSVRVTKNHRAVGVLDGNRVIWFWIGDHKAYDRYFR